MKGKKLTLLLALAVGVGLIAIYTYAQMGPGMMGPGGGWGRGYGSSQQQGWFCPYGSQWQGGGWGPGMMGRGYGYGPWYQRPHEPLDKDQAKQVVENYLNSTRNPNLKLGDIEAKDDGYEAGIVTRDDSLVDKVFVDKTTGWIRSVY